MIARLISERSGAAAAEMALVFPLLIIIMLGTFELGNYFLSEHILVKGVRDGAVFASRRAPLTSYDCAGGGGTYPADALAEAKNLVRTGQVSGGTDRLPNWDDVATVFTITPSCTSSAGGTTLSGMYSSNGGQVPVLTITARVPYRSLFGTVGFNAINLTLGATEQTAAVGI